MAVKTVKKKPRFGAIFVTNFTIFWLCVCLTLTIISIGTNRWYIRHDDNIAFQHGGLWNECMGDIDRTFCSPLRNVPGTYMYKTAFVNILSRRNNIKLNISSIQAGILQSFNHFSFVPYSLSTKRKKPWDGRENFKAIR